jgi:putative DNA primase/helicase
VTAAGPEFIAKVFGPSTEHPVYFSSLPNDRRPNGERHLMTRQVDEIEAFVARWDVPGRAVYYAANTVVPNAPRRAKDTISEINALYADIDLKDVEEDADEIRRRLSSLMRPPSVRVFTGHGFHVLWLLKEAIDAQEHRDEVEDLLRQLAAVVGGDPSVAEIARLLRLPGTHNSKNGNGEFVEVVAEVFEADRRYELADLSEWLDEARVILIRKFEGVRHNGGARCGLDNPFAKLAHDQIVKAPIDVERRLADMVYRAPGESRIHSTQLCVSAAMAIQGVVETLLPATRRAAGSAWDGEHWNERREERGIRKMYRDWAKKLGLTAPPHVEMLPPTSESELESDLPPPPDNVTELRPKLRRKAARSVAQSTGEPEQVGEDATLSPPPQPTPREPYNRPVIPLRPGHLPTTLDAAEVALKAAGFPVLALDTILVCPRRVRRPASDGREVETTRFIPISTGQMRRWLGEAAAFTRFDKRSKRYVPCDPPAELARALLETPSSWSFPGVAGLASCPVMRADGSICTASGYDPATQLYLALDPALGMPDIPENPTRLQADIALLQLRGLLSEFRFETDTDRAVALAWLMVPALRPGMEVSPLMLFRANVSGSGKSYLVDLGAAIASGQKAAAVIGAGPNHEETEKRLSALLLEGVTHIAVDNLDTDIEGKSIWCFVSERPRLRLRILGVSKAPEIGNVAFCTATGNNVRAKDDLIRRVLTCTMNVPIERPEKRKFTKNPVQMVLADRGKYLAAIFTIVRLYQAAGSPDLGDDMWESYTEFVRLVRNPLRYLDAKLDPVRSVETARAEDPTIEAIRELFDHWEKLLKADEPVGAYEVYEKATERDPQLDKLNHPEFRDLLLRAAAGKYGKISSKSIDSWLRKIKGRVIDRKRLVLATGPSARRGAQYRLEDAPEDDGGDRVSSASMQ